MGISMNITSISRTKSRDEHEVGLIRRASHVAVEALKVLETGWAPTQLLLSDAQLSFQAAYLRSIATQLRASGV